MPSYSEYPDRLRLNNELHSRPALAASSPVRCSHLAFLSGEAGYGADWRHIGKLCEELGVPLPPKSARHHVIDAGTFQLKWERHTEVSRITVVQPGASGHPFQTVAVDCLPASWLDKAHGYLLAAVQLEAVTEDGVKGISRQDLLATLAPDGVVGGTVSKDAAEVMTGFRLHGDGFGRILIVDKGLQEGKLGRLIQRLLEIETYRMMALLGLSPARRALRRIARLETELDNVVGQLAIRPDDDGGAQALLGRITDLSAHTEHLASSNAFRFSASRAYHQLVERRLDEMQEGYIEGLQRMSTFLRKRLDPAMETCAAADRRMQALSARVSRAADLLRTRVDLALEQQNQALLSSMERRARLQVRLQEVVESFSVVAITYYLLSILGYVFKGVHDWPDGITPTGVLAVLAPIIFVGNWILLRRIRKSLARTAEETPEKSD